MNLENQFNWEIYYSSGFEKLDYVPVQKDNLQNSGWSSSVQMMVVVGIKILSITLGWRLYPLPIRSNPGIDAFVCPINVDYFIHGRRRSRG